MSTVYFGSYDSTTWNMDFLGYTIESPTAKTNTVSIPLRDGVIDLTESLGGFVRYSNRKIKMRFELRDGRASWPTKMSTIRSAIHGQVLDVILPDDSTYRWHGRLSVTNFVDNTSSATVEMELDANPFKFSGQKVKVGDYTITAGTEETAAVNVTTDRAYLMFDVTGNVTVGFDGDEINFSGNGIYADANVVYVIQVNDVQYALDANINAVPGLYLGKGTNNITMNGSGTVTIWTYNGSL